MQDPVYTPHRCCLAKGPAHSVVHPLQSGRWSNFETREDNVALQINQKVVDGVTVLSLNGRIVLGDETNALREKVKSLIGEGQKKILLNLDNVTLIDSTGLGTLVALHHSASTHGSFVRLSNLGTKFQEVLQVTKLLTVFDVSPTEAAGIASFSK